MRPFSEMTDERRCEAGAGLHCKSAEWREILEDGTWDGAWPVIDRDGKLTGRVIDCVDGYLNVDEEAMISEDEARAGDWTIDAKNGRAEPRVVARRESRAVEGTGWYVYIRGEDAGGPFETEADALEHWQAASGETRGT